MRRMEINPKEKRLVSNTGMLMAMTIVKYLLPLLTLPYLTRVLTPDYYGIITYMTSTMMYFQTFVDFGFIYSATREVSINRDNKSRLQEILAVTISAKLALSLIGLIILLIIIPFVRIMRENFVLCLLYYASVVSTVFLPDFIYRGIEKMEIVSIRFVIARLISTLLTFVLIKSSDDLLLVPVLTICGNICASAFSFYHLYYKERVKVCFSTRLSKITSSIKVSSTFFLATFATTAFGATTTFLMGVMNLNNSDIAYWSLAYQIVCTIEMMYEPIISSLFPYMIKERDYRMIRKMMAIFMPIIMLCVGILFINTDVIIRIAGGEEYAQSAVILRILLPMLIFSFPAQLLGFPMLAPLEKEKYASFATVVAAVFHVIGLITLIIIGRFEIVKIAALRTSTNMVLLVSRIVLVIYVFKKINMDIHNNVVNSKAGS